MKTIKQLLTTIAVLLFSLTANAYDFEVDGIYYNILSSEDLTAEVKSGDNEYTGDIIIPSTVTFDGNEYRVTSIGEFAFSDCSSLTSIEIPSSVTTIEFGAFSDCSSLTSIEIPNSVTSIKYCAFSACSSLTSIEIPSSVTTIEIRTFEDCSSLESIEIPNSITSIEFGAFWGCLSLESIEIPSGVTSIGDNAFIQCSSLSSVTIGYSVENIGGSAFSGCSSLTDIYMKGLPPTIVDDDNFTNAQYMNTTLHVPEGLLTEYQSAEVWENFINIKEYYETGIEDIDVSNITIEVTSNGISLLNADNNNIAIYSINGILVKIIDNYTGEEITLNKGVYIISVGNKVMKIKL